MSKHTPGPWVVGNQDPLNFGVRRGQGTEPIGFVYGPSFPERSEVGQRALADARLIAAAPRMLELLKRLLPIAEDAAESLGRFCSDEGWAQEDMDRMDNVDGMLPLMRAVIAKAEEGEQA